MNEKLQHEVDSAVRAFAQRVAAGPSTTTGIPKPPTVELFEQTLEPGGFLTEAGSTSEARDVPTEEPVDCATDCPPNCDDCPTGCDEADLITVTGAVNGVPATLNVCSDGAGWTAV